MATVDLGELKLDRYLSIFDLRALDNVNRNGYYSIGGCACMARIGIHGTMKYRVRGRVRAGCWG